MRPTTNPLPPSRTNPKAAKLLGLNDAGGDGAANGSTNRKLAPNSASAVLPPSVAAAGTATAASGGGSGGSGGSGSGSGVARPNGGAAPSAIFLAPNAISTGGAGSSSLFAKEREDKPYSLPPTPKKALDQQRTISGGASRTDMKSDSLNAKTPTLSPGTRGLPPPSPRLLHQMSDFSLPAAATAGGPLSAAAVNDEEQRLFFAGDRHLKSVPAVTPLPTIPC